MTFPTSPTNGQNAVEFGKTFVYSSASATWMPVSSPSTPTVRESIPTPIVVSTSLDLPMIGNTAGRTGYVSDTNRLYIWNGTGWFQIALINTNPTITDGGQATYELATDGTPTVVTLTANDPEGLPLTWSYSISSGALCFSRYSLITALCTNPEKPSPVSSFVSFFSTQLSDSNASDNTK